MLDLTDQIIAYEEGGLDNAGVLELFGRLIKNGMAWTLQGHYGRAASALIDGGYLDAYGTILKGE